MNPVGDHDDATFLLVTDVHHGDGRGEHELSLEGMADVLNGYQADAVLNLNDSVPGEERLRCRAGERPSDARERYWLEYRCLFTERLNKPVFDVGLWRDLAIWPHVSDNEPRGRATVSGIELMWLCPEQGVLGCSEAQIEWAIDEMRKSKDRRWLIASHGPIYIEPGHDAGLMENGMALYDAALRHTASCVFAAGHLHLSQHAPHWDEKRLSMIAGAMNTLGAGCQSYARRLVFKSDGALVVECLHLNRKQVVATWSFDVPDGP